MTEICLSMLSGTVAERARYICLSLLLGVALWGVQQSATVQPVAQAQAGFSCAAVSQIPQDECEALVALYDANPIDWREWLTTNSPCSWDSIFCKNGHVTKIILTNRGLTTIPAEIENLSSLELLSLGGSKLTSLPPEIGNLPSLTKLRLNHNRLTSFTPEISNLPSLDWLELSDNQLTSLPPEIGDFSSLTYLRLDDNQLTSLPPEIGNLTSLSYFYLPGNQLTSLPPEIGNLSSLLLLHLGDNPLTSLPSEIGNLSSLGRLTLLRTQLTSLPPEIGDLHKLYYLNLTGSQLTSLPPEIGNLPRLGGLWIADNKLTSLPPEIGNLSSSLALIEAQDNQLTSLPPEIGNLSSLSWLNLDNNQLTSLPPEIGDLSSLRWLHLTNNQLNSLPFEIGNLSKLIQVKTSGNPSIIQPARIFTNSSPSSWSGTIERSMSGPYYVQGTSVELTAVSDENWRFVYWKGPQVSGAQEYQPTITITAGQGIESYKAHFVERDQHNAINTAARDVNNSDSTDAVDASTFLQCTVGISNAHCPDINVETSTAENEAELLEEVERMLREQGLWSEQTVDLLLPIVVK